MSTLVITEKKAQVEALGKIVKLSMNRGYHKGTYQGEELVVFPLKGHILDILDVTPRDYDANKLPILPSIDKIMKRGLQPIDEDRDSEATKKNKKEKKQKYSTLKKILGEYSFSKIILATDPDYEGCAIGKEILDEFNLESIQTNYMDIHNITPKILKRELDKALKGQDAMDWRKWALIAHIRGDVNDRTGIDGSHYIFKTTKTFTTFGSQQTRALEVLVQRERERESFDTSKRYRVRLKTSVGDFLLDAEENDLDNKDRETFNSIYKSTQGKKTFEINNLDIKKTILPAPAWYDGSDIAGMAAEELGKSFDEMFSQSNGLLQMMYQQAKTTYPRGEAKGVMPISQIEEQKEIATMLSRHYDAPRLDTSIFKDYLWRDDEKEPKEGEELINHTPCTIASSELDFSSLSSDEKVVIDIMAKMILSCFYPEAKTKNIIATGLIDGYVFEHQSTSDDDMGWRDLYGKKKRESAISGFSEGDIVEILDVKLEEYTNNPPKQFTEKALVKELKRRKIGAESTFVAHVQKILSRERGFAEKKGNYIVPTIKAIKFIEMIPKETMEVLALLEEEVFKKLLAGEIDENTALMGRYRIIEKVFADLKKAIDTHEDLWKYLKTDSPAKNPKVGDCPICGGNIISGGAVFTCENKKDKKVGDNWESSGCTFVVWKKSDTKSFSYLLSDSVFSSILESGSAKVPVFFKETERKDPITLKLTLQEEIPRIELVF